MKYFLILAFVSLFCFQSRAQVPGYMGKGLALYYNPAVFISIYPEPGLNLRHDFSADYTVSKSIAAGGSVKLVSTRIKDAVYYGDYVNGVQEIFEGDIKLKGPAFSVYLKKFSFRKRGYISPVGHFNKFELCYGSYTGNTATLTQNSNENPHIRLEYLGFNTHHTTAGFIYSFGRQALYFDRLFITTGGSIALMLPTGSASGGLQGTGGDETDYRANASARMFGYFLFNINLGIGFLAL
ncbi:MAG: hypothetical protein ABIQ74_12715 [Chitinophagales bacterium]